MKTYGNDSGLVEVAGCASDDAAEEKTTNDTARLHDWRAKSFAEKNSHEHEETKS